MADLSFGAWAHSSIGAAIERVDDGGPLSPAEFDVSVRLTGPGAGGRVGRAKPLRMLGPGGVQAIDARSVRRVFPAAGAADAFGNDMAAVELSPPELPWLLTPAAPFRGPGNGRLRPWIVLVVVDAANAFDPAARPLPRLVVATRELPDLTDSWAWAHVQSSPNGEEMIARLLCPRLLPDDRRYRACVVPAFQGGVAAGLGVTGEPTESLAHAWGIGTGEEQVTLPVYYWWEFGTGPPGDFEDYVRRLRPVESMAGMGGHDVDISEPWPGMPPLAGTDGPLVIRVDGVLRPPTEQMAPPEELPFETLSDLRTRLSKELAVPADRLEGTHDPGDVTGAVAPPIYGGKHAGLDRVEPSPELPLPDLGWTTELNLEPPFRIAAALGADYVRAHQEELMARAWDQVGAIREANRRRAMAELSAEVAASLHRRHVATLAPGELVTLAAPASARTRTAEEGGPTLALEITASPLADAAASTGFARLMRPSGHIARRTTAGIDSVVTKGLMGQATVAVPDPVLPRQTSDRPSPERAARQIVMLDAVRKVAGVNDLGAAGAMVSERLGAIGGLDAIAFEPREVDTIAGVLVDQMEVVGQSFQALAETDFSSAAAGDGRMLTATGVQIAPDVLTGRLASALHPGEGIVRRLNACLSVPGAIDQPGLAPLMSHPVFAAPMSLAMLAETPEWLLPGLGDFPAERVGLLQSNNRFIESYLVGLNHEMMSELLWREYPTDQRGSPFRRFWPQPGSDSDVPPLTDWHTSLGMHGNFIQDLTVLLVRGEIVRRFPDMVVTAVRAVLPEGATRPTPSTVPEDVSHPLFTLPLDPATAAYAFAVPPGELTAPVSAEAPGWFMVFQEHDYRMRFGFDVANETFGKWDDLDWPRVDPTNRGFAVAGTDITAPGENPLNLVWGSGADSTHIARIALQKPFSVAMHAALLLGRGRG
ncbi:hypothetical protein [Spongiactinospora sp. TRM90649]|uniref:hypothetical protein n=1 Tax=Spongiactinospora sp. TRM90649 TaxID=3031114 RepID=UPI0023F9BE23|nr:hypothetical protein [Spongiactinospora sp. TRM90649]MDF5753244.1 hypothetical protein [Spongiactinospora sp. TRM90649]